MLKDTRKCARNWIFVQWVKGGKEAWANCVCPSLFLSPFKFLLFALSLSRSLMMIIAFIISIVEVLCAQICFGLEISEVLRSHLLFFSRKKNIYYKEKKQSFQDLMLPPTEHIHTHLYFVYICEYIYAEIKSIWILRALQVSHPNPWAYIRVPCSVCVCVLVHSRSRSYTHIHSHPP